MKRLSPSIGQTKIFEETGLETVEDLMYADLRASGWDKWDAFYAVFRDEPGEYTKKNTEKVIREMEHTPAIVRRMNRNKGGEAARLGDAELARETSKEKILSDLVIARRKMKEGTKEWAETTKMIGDYARIKQDDIKTDERPIRYYLPVKYPTSCENCLLRAKKKPERLDGSE